MRVGVNVRLLTGSNLEGIGRFTFETLKEMVIAHPEHEFIFFFDRKWDNRFVFSKNIIPVVIKPMAIHPVLWYLWFEWRLPYFLKRYNIDVFLSMDGFTSLRTNVPTCMVVHDLAFLHYPEFFKRRTSMYYNYFVPLFLNKVQTVATVSSYTMKDVVSIVPEKKDRVSVVYCAASDVYKPIDDVSVEKVRFSLTSGAPYFLFVGALHPRKNVVNLIRAFKKFKEDTKSPIKLVVVGRYAWRSDAIKKEIESFPFQKELIYVGSVTDQKLPGIVAAAYAVVYPSIFEGFGIPILEAMLCDVPVITSNSSSMPEVGGDAALYINPLSEEDIKDKLVRIATDEKLRSEMIQKSRLQRAKFNWELTAKKLWDSVELARKL